LTPQEVSEAFKYVWLVIDKKNSALHVVHSSLVLITKWVVRDFVVFVEKPNQKRASGFLIVDPENTRLAHSRILCIGCCRQNP